MRQVLPMITIYPNAEEKRSDIGISGLLNDSEFNLVSKGLKRLERREQYETNPEHASLKDQRENGIS